jgi:adenosylcobinamide kinase / adenosylcobinamide-phosphate guanylyltransferase
VLILILGGARSGKSSLALQMARRFEANASQTEQGANLVTMVATAPVIPEDHDLSARIHTHRSERPAHWSTVEEPEDLRGALSGLKQSASTGFVIIDCLTLWVNNLLWRGDTPEQVMRTATETAQVAASLDPPVVAVSNEVGLGVHPATAEGREFRDLLGRVNAIWAGASDRSLFLVAGQIMHLTDPAATLDEIFGPRKDPDHGR